MRITQNSGLDRYLLNLNSIETRQSKDQYKQSTGKDMESIADDPGRMVNVKQLSETINKNATYLENIASGLSELQYAGEQIDSMSEKFQRLRSLAVDATATGNSGNVFTLGVYVKGILNDLVNDANSDYNGKFLFSGTKTTEESITPGASGDKKPFELITDTPTSDNPSGLKVVFKGNTEDRSINKDAVSTEVISTNPKDLFGTNITELFAPVIKLYNIMTYNADGTKRDVNSAMTTDDVSKVNAAQAEIAQFNDNINKVSSVNGSKIIRLEALQSQTENQQIRLKDYRSLNEDADVAKTTLELAKENNILNYALQTGGSLIGKSLFDFLG